jgi:hypothetical protein
MASGPIMEPSEKGPFGILISKAEPTVVTDVSFIPLTASIDFCLDPMESSAAQLQNCV